MTVSNQLFSGAAAFGRFSSLIGAVIVSLISVALFYFGYKETFDVAKKYSASAQATIKVASCSPTSQGNFQCAVTYVYTVSGKKYEGSGSVSGSSKTVVGDVLTIYYNPNQPDESIFDAVPPKYIGYGLALFAVFLLTLAWGNYYLTTKSKGYAAVTGAVDAVRALR